MAAGLGKLLGAGVGDSAGEGCTQGGCMISTFGEPGLGVGVSAGDGTGEVFGTNGGAPLPVGIGVGHNCASAK